MSSKILLGLAGLALAATTISAFPTNQVPFTEPEAPCPSTLIPVPSGEGNSTSISTSTGVITDQSTLSFNGSARSFNATSIQGACGKTTCDHELVVGISKDLLTDSSSVTSTCGKCVALSSSQDTSLPPVIAQVQDVCETCEKNDICK